MFSENEIINDFHFKEFLQNRNLKPNSIINYTQALKSYSTYTELTPTELIEQAEQEEEERIRMKNRQIKKHILGFIQHQKNQGKSANTIINHITKVKTFYREFEIELPHIRCNIQKEQELITIKDIPTKDDIKKALKYANLKYKAIILLMMSSGMGSAEMRNLTIKDYIDAHKITNFDLKDKDQLISLLRKKENEVPTWSIRRIKTGMPYVTFSSPESCNAINDYIEDRVIEYPYENENDYLFESNGHQIHPRVNAVYFSRLNDSVGFGKYGNQRFFRSHNLRKFFASTLKNNGFDNLDAEWLIGHKVKMVTDAYIKPDIYRLKKDYLDVLPFLSLEEIEKRTVESDEYKQLKEQYEKESKSRDEEIKKLTEQNKLTMKLVEDLIKDMKSSE